LTTRLGMADPALVFRRPATSSSRTLSEIMAAYERVVIIQALQLNNFSRKLTAVSLGIKRDRLYKRMRFLKIDLREIPKSPGRPQKRT
jgi:DNA-binding NtrC family response regulator